MADQFPTHAAPLHAIIADHEDWLVDRILFYAKRQGYTSNTSTLREAWRQSIAGFSASLLAAMEEGVPDIQIGPDQDFTGDPLARFGMAEAQRQREQGVGLAMFLGLMKYYRQSYMDLIHWQSPDPACNRRISQTLNRFFDRIEIGLCMAWQVPDTNDQIKNLRKETNRSSERLKGVLELAGAVCHDINQPLMAISGYAELLLLDCPDDGPHVPKLKKIVEQVAKVGEITRKLMHVTHYETKTYLDKQIIDIEKSSSRSRTESET